MSTYYMFPSRYPNNIICIRCGYYGPSVVKNMEDVMYYKKESKWFFIEPGDNGKKVYTEVSTMPRWKRKAKLDAGVKYKKLSIEGFSKAPVLDDVDTCPHCGEHRTIGSLILKWNKDLNRFILCTNNEPNTRKPYVREQHLLSDRLWNSLEMRILKTRQWDEIESLKRRGSSTIAAKARHKAEQKALAAKLTATKGNREYFALNKYKNRLWDKYVWDALRKASYNEGKKFFHKKGELIEELDRYGLKGNLGIIDDKMLMRFFPNYGKKSYIEMNESVYDAWDAKYHNGSALFRMWENLTFGYESSLPMVISKKAFTLLSKAQKTDAIIIVRHKKLAVYERDLRDMMDRNEEVAEWYTTRPNQVDDPSISLERGEAPNGIRIIDGKEYFFDPTWNNWIECNFEESDRAKERFVSYSEYQEDYDEDDETKLYEMESYSGVSTMMEDTVDEESDYEVAE